MYIGNPHTWKLPEFIQYYVNIARVNLYCKHAVANKFHLDVLLGAVSRQGCNCVCMLGGRNLCTLLHYTKIMVYLVKGHTAELYALWDAYRQLKSETMQVDTMDPSLSNSTPMDLLNPRDRLHLEREERLLLDCRVGAKETRSKDQSRSTLSLLSLTITRYHFYTNNLLCFVQGNQWTSKEKVASVMCHRA